MTIKARVAIVGGGIVGCSIAYHLGKLGWKDVHVIEKGELTSGSTWHAAGLVGQLRSSRNITRMLKKSVELYGKLEAETGQATGWKEVGGLRLASSQDRMFEIKKAATTAKSYGMEMHLLDSKEAQELFPLMSTEGVVGAAFLPSDGYADPSMITQALAKGARSSGVKFHRNCRVTSVEIKNGKCTKLISENETFEAEIVVNAAGMWAREFGAMAGVNVPLIPVEHQYMVTEPIPGMKSGYPTMRDPDHLVYYKEEMGGLVMGGYEPNPVPWSIEGIPKDFGQELLKPDFDHFSDLFEKAAIRTPVLNEVGVRKLINGPEAFTSDGNFIMGRAPEVRNYYVAAGFNAHGIAAGGGAGLMLAEWIVYGEPSLDLWEVDIRRFGPYHKDLGYVKTRTSELYGKHYTMHWPHEEHETARGTYLSPLYDRLKSHGAVFGSRFGWERPNWFAPKGVEPKDHLTFGFANWHEHVGNECRAIRKRVGLIDQSSFSKISVKGPGVAEFLNTVATNDVDQPAGSLVYTQLCNLKGGIEADLTMGRISEDEYYIVTGTAFGTHDRYWILEQLPEGSPIEIKDITREWGVLNISGPKARLVTQKAMKDGTEESVSHENFAFGSWKPVEISGHVCRALRVTYVGELGWELHIPIEGLGDVYDALWEAGQEYGIVNAGYRAIESLRLEKGYRYWSTDLTPDYTPYEAGLGFCVKLKKEKFYGKEALEKAKANGVREKLICLVLEKPIPLTGGETICKDGKVIGVLSSGGYGHTVGKTIGFGYVPKKLAPKEVDENEGFSVEVMGESIPAKRQVGALVDPRREKILC